MDISRLQIDQSKMLASGAEYFKLFEKHLPTGLDSSKTVLVYEISNLSCIKKIAGLNPEAKHIVVGSKACNRALKMVLSKAIDVEYLEEFDFKETDMKFDCIVMNPPYQRNLHLKILAEAIKHLNDEKSVCVNLSPVRWLQDPLAKYKKNSDYHRFEESISKHLEDFELVNAHEANKLFSIGNFGDLGIYTCKALCEKSFNITNIAKQFIGAGYSVIEKVLHNSLDCISNHMYRGIDGIGVKVASIRGFGSGKNFDIVSLIHSTPYTSIEQYKQSKFKKKDVTSENIENEDFLKVKSIKEGINFIKSTRGIFFHFLVRSLKLDQHIPLQFLPWLGNAINPRTGLKGYEGEWTDDDLYKFFNITPEEQKLIESTMKAYEAK